MFKKGTLLFFLNLFFVAFIYAQKVDVQKAALVAQNFYAERYNGISQEKLAASHIHLELAKEKKTEKGESLLYFFEVKNGGFIIVSAHASVYPVLGYSFENKISYPLPNSALEMWLKNYETQLLYALENELQASVRMKRVWDDYAQGIFSDKGTKNVSPLLLTKWNQDKWYNEMCPLDANGPDGRVYAGCVASSMAQVMKYYNYPIQGVGSHSYNSSYGTLSADFGNTTYRWNEMPNSVSQSNSAVAELLFHCGVAVNMNYSPDGSGSETMTAANALKNYFAYHSDASFKLKLFHSNTNWANMIKDNLDNGIPLIYSGSTSTFGGGHAWNCDGYQGNDHFHMNWGWGGFGDGYFYLNALNVAGDNFNSNQGTIFDLYPAQNYPYFCSGLETLTGIVGTFDDGSNNMSYQPNSSCSWLISPVLPVSSVKLTFDRFDTEEDNDIVTVYDGETTAAPVLGTFSGSTVPPVLTANSGKMLVTFETDGLNNAFGFNASYSTTFPTYCTNLVNLTAMSDTFSDGSGQNTYNPVTNCRWRILPQGVSAITLTFHAFDLAPNDVLEVYNISGTPTILTTHSGQTIPQEETFAVEKIMLWLKTNSSNPGTGFTASYNVTPASINTLQTLNNVTVFPNPAYEFVQIIFDNKSAKEMNINIYDITGKSVYNTHNILQKGANAINISLKDFPKGIYILELKTEKDYYVKKLIAQ